MKKILILSLLALTVLVFADGISMSVSVDETSSSNSSSVNVVDEIANRIDVLQNKYFSKLNKLDQKRANKIIDEIYELLALLPDDISTSNQNANANFNITFDVNEQQAETQPSVVEHKIEIVEEIDEPVAMSSSEFQQLLSNVQDEGFADNQTSVVRIAAKSKYFSISQLITIVDEFSFSDDKINIVRIVYPRVVDTDNSHNLIGAFTFSGDKEKVEQIISQ
ncbi:MAG: DUF4476 domain-containing protein [Candidatus Cloacimonetes bacterium]|nr:DUF4476 domain-containing protein [Candidatus Cloacimonadota bacterium]